jgi:hypothetical protein
VTCPNDSEHETVMRKDGVLAVVHNTAIPNYVEVCLECEGEEDDDTTDHR